MAKEIRDIAFLSFGLSLSFAIFGNVSHAVVYAVISIVLNIISTIVYYRENKKMNKNN